MIRPLSIAALIAALATTVSAQTATDQSTGEATEQTTTTEQATPPAPPPPEYNGSVSGTASGTPVNVQVVCAGFESGGSVTLQSDPGGAQGEDLNGDGQVVDISASPDGNISLFLQTNNNIFSMTDNTATISGKTLSYSITMTFTGGDTDRIEITGTCQ